MYINTLFIIFSSNKVPIKTCKIVVVFTLLYIILLLECVYKLIGTTDTIKFLASHLMVFILA